MREREERDGLAQFIFIADNWRRPYVNALEDWEALKQVQAADTYCHHIADALIEAGYRKGLNK